jgi:hypothetical protein
MRQSVAHQSIRDARGMCGIGDAPRPPPRPPSRPPRPPGEKPAMESRRGGAVSKSNQLAKARACATTRREVTRYSPLQPR